MNETTEELIAEHNQLSLNPDGRILRYRQLSNELTSRFDAMGDEEQAEYFIELVPSEFSSSIWYRHFRPFKKPEERIYV